MASFFSLGYISINFKVLATTIYELGSRKALSMSKIYFSHVFNVKNLEIYYGVDLKKKMGPACHSVKFWKLSTYTAGVIRTYCILNFSCPPSRQAESIQN